MYAIIKTGGKQYKVTEGQEIFIEKLTAEENIDSHIQRLQSKRLTNDES